MKKLSALITPLIVFVGVVTTVYLGYVSPQTEQRIDALEESNGIESAAPTKLKSACSNFIGGAVTPLQDTQDFIDNNYTEVTLISREEWNISELPEKVLELEKENYICSPTLSAQPVTTGVEWSCELEYKSFNYKYLNGQNLDHKNILKDQGFSCEKQVCLDKNDQEDFVWLCVKS